MSEIGMWQQLWGRLWAKLIESLAALNKQPTTDRADWRPSTRIAFRFVFCYLGLYSLYSLSLQIKILKLAVTDRFTDTTYDLLWHQIVSWVGSHILHLRAPISIFTNGSGDTTYDNILILCELFVAAVVTVVWSALDRKRTEYRTLQEWLRFIVRLVLSSAMLGYGIDKLIPVQFGSLTLDRLATRVGDLTPSGLLWTFMAASKPYTIFCGAAEVLAGVLLIVPRLTTFGALISMADMINVFALDMSYDVSVKLGSLHYLLMAVFLTVPDMQRLMDVLIFNRATAPRKTLRLSTLRWVNHSAQIFLVLTALLSSAILTREGLARYARANPLATASPPVLFGVWQIDEFNMSAGPGTPLFTAKLASDLHIGPGDDRWVELIVDSASTAVIRLSNGVVDYVTLKLSGKNAASLLDDADRTWACDFVYQQTGERGLRLEGRVNGNPAIIKLHRIDSPKSILVTRGFHWINEYPF